MKQISLQLDQRDRAQAGDAAIMYLVTTVRDEANLHRFLQLLAEKNLNAELLGNGCDLLAVRFQHHLALTPRRQPLLIHKITLNNAS